jgi:signal transduction histidine kinase
VQPVLLGAPGSPQHFAELSRLNAIALATTGFFGLFLVSALAVGHEHPTGYHPQLLAGLSLIGLVMAEPLRRRLLPPRAIKIGYFVAIVGVSAGGYAAGPDLLPVVAMLYMWFGSLVTAHSRRFVLAVAAAVAVCYAVVLAIQPGNSLALLRWEVVLVVLACFALATDRLVSRARALADSEAAARAASEKARVDLEVANDEKTRFLARMSHELRTPLNAVIGFSEVLASEGYGEVNAKQAEYLGDVVDSGRHLLALVDDLLDIAKVETGAIELAIGAVDVNELVTTSANLFKEQAHRHRIDVDVAIGAGAGRIEGDARKLRQVVFNLLANAFNFTPDGGRVRVSVRPTATTVELLVEDTGPGIPVADRERIFGEFDQAHESGTGTGLGLALARRFVERHSGRLWVDGATIGGAAFHVELPRRLRPDAGAARETTPHPEPLAPTRRILGEDDTPERRRESAAVVLILTVGCCVAAAVAAVALTMFPDAAEYDHPLAFSVNASIALVVLVWLRWKPESLGSPSALPFFAGGCGALFCISAFDLGPVWGQYLGPFYAWAVAAGVLAIGMRGSAATLLCIAVGHALVLANQPAVIAPVARWLVTIGYVGITAAIFRRFIVRIQDMTDANHAARAEADDIGAQLAVATRHKTDFLTNMSHELRTPLNAIIGFSEVLEQQVYGPLNDKQLDYVRDVLDAGRHLLGLINEILDLAKVEAGRMELRPAVIDVNDVVSNTVASFERIAAERGVRLETAAAAVDGIALDEAKVRHVVANLVSNAVKFAPTGEHVSVRTSGGDDFVEITVADTGPGITVDEQERIFDPFAHGEAGTPEQGPGLGLALARRYAELHGGTLTVDSSPGHGATFTLRLPARELTPAEVTT